MSGNSGAGDLQSGDDVPMEWFMEWVVDRGTELEAGDDDLDAALAASEPLGGRLAALMVPPADFGSRMADGVAEGLLARSTLTAAVDLLGTGWRTLRWLAAPLERPDIQPPGESRS